MNTFNVTNKHRGRSCRFDGYDDNQHFGKVVRVRHNIITVAYYIRGIDTEIVAHVPKTEHRITVL